MTELQFINPAALPPPVGQYTNVAIAEAGARTAYIAGQLPIGTDGAVVAPGDIDQQADHVFSLLQRALEALGASLADVAFIRAYLVADHDLAAFRQARQRAYESAGIDEPPPATTVVVSALVGGALIELDAVAVSPAS